MSTVYPPSPGPPSPLPAPVSTSIQGTSISVQLKSTSPSTSDLTSISSTSTSTPIPHPLVAGSSMTPGPPTSTSTHTPTHPHIHSRYPGRNRSRSNSQPRSRSKSPGLVGGSSGSGVGGSDEGVETSQAGGGDGIGEVDGSGRSNVNANVNGFGDGTDPISPEFVNDDNNKPHSRLPYSPPRSMRKMLKSTADEPSSTSSSGPALGPTLGGFSFPPQASALGPIASTSTSPPAFTLPASPSSSSSSRLHPNRNPKRLPIPSFASIPSTHPTPRTLNTSAGGLFPALSRKALLLRGEAQTEAEAEIKRSNLAQMQANSGPNFLPNGPGVNPSSTQNHPAGPVNVREMQKRVETSSISTLGGMKHHPPAAYGHLGGHGMFLPDLGMTFGSLTGGGGGGKRSHPLHDDHPHIVNMSTGLPGQTSSTYMPDPPMTLADRRRVHTLGAQNEHEKGSGKGEHGSETASRRHRFSLSLSLHPRRRRKSADADARRRGVRGSRRRNKSVEPVSKSVEMSRMDVGRRRGGGGSDEVQESESDRKRREAESVIAWKVWAAACVASNTVPVDLDLFRPPTPYTTPTTSRLGHRPRLPLRPSSAGDGPPRSLYDSSSTISTEDAIVSPSTEPGGPSWVAVGKRPLVHSFSMDEISGIKHVEGRNHSMPDISIEGAAEPGRSGTRSPRHRRRSTKMLVPDSVASQRTSATPTPEPPRLNPLLPLRSRLSNKHVRTIALELVHALSSYVELRSQLDDNDAEFTITVLPPWSRRALDAARAQGLLDPPTVGEAKFQDAEIIALFRDLDEIIGYPGYVRKMLMSDTQFHSVVFEEPRRLAVPDDSGYSLDLATCERTLRDLEDVIWGRSEPHPDDIAYGELVLLVGTTDPSLIATVGAQSSSAISSSLFDILAEPIPVSLSHARDTEDLRETRSAAMRKQSLFANLSVSRGKSIVYVPGVSSMDIANFKIASSGRNSVDPLERTPEPPKTRTVEDLAQEGRARYEAWQKSRQVQPLKRA